MIDLTPHIHRDKPFRNSDNSIDVFMTIDKYMYDAIRTHDGTFLVDDREYNLLEFNTNYIGLGKEFDIHLGVVLTETISSVRNKKIKELGL